MAVTYYAILTAVGAAKLANAAALGTTLQIQHAPAQLRRVLQLAGIRCTDASKTEE